ETASVLHDTPPSTGGGSHASGRPPRRDTTARVRSPRSSPYGRRLGGKGSGGGVTPAAFITRRNAATGVGEGLKLPNRNPCAMRRGVHPKRFFLFHTSMRAPFSARNSTAPGKFL